MLDFFFGWRKASKWYETLFIFDVYFDFTILLRYMNFIYCWVFSCFLSKKLIRITQCRLKLLISKKFAVIRILKEDIAQLLKNGHEQIASNKVSTPRVTFCPKTKFMLWKLK
mgnify:CR=1 FL=1